MADIQQRVVVTVDDKTKAPLDRLNRRLDQLKRKFDNLGKSGGALGKGAFSGALTELDKVRSAISKTEAAMRRLGQVATRTNRALDRMQRSASRPAGGSTVSRAQGSSPFPVPADGDFRKLRQYEQRLARIRATQAAINRLTQGQPAGAISGNTLTRQRAGGPAGDLMLRAAERQVAAAGRLEAAARALMSASRQGGASADASAGGGGHPIGIPIGGGMGNAADRIERAVRQLANQRGGSKNRTAVDRWSSSLRNAALAGNRAGFETMFRQARNEMTAKQLVALARGVTGAKGLRTGRAAEDALRNFMTAEEERKQGKKRGGSGGGSGPVVSAFGAGYLQRLWDRWRHGSDVSQYIQNSKDTATQSAREARQRDRAEKRATREYNRIRRMPERKAFAAQSVWFEHHGTPAYKQKLKEAMADLRTQERERKKTLAREAKISRDYQRIRRIKDSVARSLAMDQWKSGDRLPIIGRFARGNEQAGPINLSKAVEKINQDYRERLQRGSTRERSILGRFFGFGRSASTGRFAATQTPAAARAEMANAGSSADTARRSQGDRGDPRASGGGATATGGGGDGQSRRGGLAGPVDTAANAAYRVRRAESIVAATRGAQARALANAGATNSMMMGGAAGVAGFMSRSSTGLGLRQIAAFGGVFGAVQLARAGIATAAETELGMIQSRAVTEGRLSQKLGLGQDINRLALTSPFSPGQLYGASRYMGQAGIDAATQRGLMPTIQNAAMFTGMDMPRVADLVTNIATAIGQLDKVPQVVDKITALTVATNTDLSQLASAAKYGLGASRAGGFGIDQSLAMMALAANTGMQGPMGGTGHRAFLMQLQTMTAPKKKALAAAGADLFDSSGKLKTRDLEKIIGELGNAYRKDPDIIAGTFRQRAGAYISSILSQIEDDPKVMSRLMGRQRASAGLGERLAQKRLSTLQHSWDTLKSRMQALAISAGDAGLNDLLKAAAENLGSMAIGLGSVFDAIRKNVTDPIRSSEHAYSVQAAEKALAAARAGGDPISIAKAEKALATAKNAQTKFGFGDRIAKAEALDEKADLAARIGKPEWAMALRRQAQTMRNAVDRDDLRLRLGDGVSPDLPSNPSERARKLLRNGVLPDRMALESLKEDRGAWEKLDPVQRAFAQSELDRVEAMKAGDYVKAQKALKRLQMYRNGLGGSIDDPAGKLERLQRDKLEESLRKEDKVFRRKFRGDQFDGENKRGLFQDLLEFLFKDKITKSKPDKSDPPRTSSLLNGLLGISPANASGMTPEVAAREKAMMAQAELTAAIERSRDALTQAATQIEQSGEAMGTAMHDAASRIPAGADAIVAALHETANRIKASGQAATGRLSTQPTTGAYEPVI